MKFCWNIFSWQSVLVARCGCLFDPNAWLAGACNWVTILISFLLSHSFPEQFFSSNSNSFIYLLPSSSYYGFQKKKPFLATWRLFHFLFCTFTMHSAQFDLLWSFLWIKWNRKFCLKYANGVKATKKRKKGAHTHTSVEYYYSKYNSLTIISIQQHKTGTKTWRNSNQNVFLFSIFLS